MFRILKELYGKIKTRILSIIAKIKFQKAAKSQTGETAPHENLDKKLVFNLLTAKVPSFSQLKQLPRILNSREKRIISVMVALIGLSLGFLGYRFYTKNFPVVPVSGGEYTEGLVGAPRYINPLLAQTNDVDLDLSRLIFSGLLKYGRNLELIPDLAESYTVSEDQKTYEFVLRENSFWHDGAPVTPDDIVFTYESMFDPEFKSPLRFSIARVKVEKTGFNKVSFTLQEPQPAFLQLMTTGILPEHIWGKIPPINSNLTSFNLRPVGAGPWKFKTLAKDTNGNIKTFTLTPHEDYHGKKPYIKKLTFKFFQNFDSAIDAVNNRTIEGISYVSKEKKNHIKNPNIQFYAFHLPQYTAIFFNAKNNALLKDISVRKALSLAIDKTAIFTEAIKFQGEIIDGPILPGFPGFEENNEWSVYNPDEAKAALEKNGWKEVSAEDYENALRASTEENQAIAPDNAAPAPDTAPQKETSTPEEQTQKTYRKKGDKFLKVVITTVDIPEYVTTAQLVRQYWQNIGVTTEIKTVREEKVLREVIKPRNYEIFIYGENYGHDPDPFPFWHSSQTQDPGLNLALYANRNIDKLLDDARKTDNTEDKTALYEKFQETLMADYPAIFLYSPTYTYAVHEKIHLPSMERIVLPSDRLAESEQWYIVTGRRWAKPRPN